MLSSYLFKTSFWLFTLYFVSCNLDLDTFLYNSDFISQQMKQQMWTLRGGTTAYLDSIAHPVITNPCNMIYANNALFVASFTLNHVVRFVLPTQESAQVTQFKVFITGNSLDGPSGLAYDDYLNWLFVSSFGSDEVLAYDADDGSLQKRYGNENELDCPEAIAIGPDGLLYVGSYLKGWIVRYNITTSAFLGVFAMDRQLQLLEEMVFHGSKLLISSFFSNAIFQFNISYSEKSNILSATEVVSSSYLATSNRISNFFSSPTIRGPVGLVVGPDKNVYVTSYKRNVVIKLNGQNGNYIGLAAVGGDMQGVSSICFGPDGTLFVASYQDHRISRFNYSTGSQYQTNRNWPHKNRLIWK